MPSDEVLSGFDLPNDQIAGSYDLVIIGEKGKLLFNRGRTEWLTSPASLLEDFEAPEPTLPRVPNEDAEWLAACEGGPPSLSNFDYSARSPSSSCSATWRSGSAGRSSGTARTSRPPTAPEADELIRREYRKGWEV